MSLTSGFGCLHSNRTDPKKAIYVWGKLQSDQLQHSLDFADFFYVKVLLSGHTCPTSEIEMCGERASLWRAFEAALTTMLYGNTFVWKRAQL